MCEDDDAVAVSCLDLCYSVKFKAKKALKDERKDQTAPIVLSNIAEDDSDSEPEDGICMYMHVYLQLSLSLSLSPLSFSFSFLPPSLFLSLLSAPLLSSLLSSEPVRYLVCLGSGERSLMACFVEQTT
ncbi:MAG: hypothetical protein MJE68_15295 [Proteobacteria bacterium]|nr:hypothetical protein [Pseudomonadota bacterium]